MKKYSLVLTSIFALTLSAFAADQSSNDLAAQSKMYQQQLTQMSDLEFADQFNQAVAAYANHCGKNLWNQSNHKKDETVAAACDQASLKMGFVNQEMQERSQRGIEKFKKQLPQITIK